MSVTCVCVSVCVEGEVGYWISNSGPYGTVLVKTTNKLYPLFITMFFYSPKPFSLLFLCKMYLVKTSRTFALCFSYSCRAE